MRQLKNFSNKNDKGKTDKEVAGDYIKKYDGFSEEQLIDELVKNVKKSKDSGSYSSEQMKTFIDMVSPQMTAEQRTKLNNLVKLIQEDEI